MRSHFLLCECITEVQQLKDQLKDEHGDDLLQLCPHVQRDNLGDGQLEDPLGEHITKVASETTAMSFYSFALTFRETFSLKNSLTIKISFRGGKSSVEV